ncbi:MAG TPA: hypothetical protein VNB29_05905 [Chthoniobacterales bacterium]|nr:hypothetical protein [Chthoniobacterales bacterium]
MKSYFQATRVFILVSICLLGSRLALAADHEKIAGDALTGFLADTPPKQPADPKEFTPDIWKNLSFIQPGTTRSELQKHLRMNGGVAEDEYLLALNGKQGEVPRALLVKVIFRPAGMDEATFLDPKQRETWQKAHPNTAPFAQDDVIVSWGKPFWGGYSWD